MRSTSVPIDDVAGDHADVNGVIGGFLRDMAFAQASPPKMFGYERAAAAILALDEPLTALITADGMLHGGGPVKPRAGAPRPESSRILGGPRGEVAERLKAAVC